MHECWGVMDDEEKQNATQKQQAFLCLQTIDHIWLEQRVSPFLAVLFNLAYQSPDVSEAVFALSCV